MNPKLLKRMDRKPRIVGKEMVYVPLGLSNNALKSGANVTTTSLCDKAGTIEVKVTGDYESGKKYRVFLKDLCKP